MRRVLVMLLVACVVAGCQPKMRRDPEEKPLKEKINKVVATSSEADLPGLGTLEQGVKILLDFDLERQPAGLDRSELQDARGALSLVRGELRKPRPESLWVKTAFKIYGVARDYPILIEGKVLRDKVAVGKFRTVLFSPRSRRAGIHPLPIEFSHDVLADLKGESEGFMAHAEAKVRFLPQDTDLEALKTENPPEADLGRAIIMSNPVRISFVEGVRGS